MATEIAMILGMLGATFMFALFPKVTGKIVKEESMDVLAIISVGIILGLLLTTSSLINTIAVDNANAVIQASTQTIYRIFLWLFCLYLAYTFAFFGLNVIKETKR